MPVVATPFGTRISYTDSGAGLPVVLVHGSPGEGRSWARVAKTLTEGHRLLTPDLPGYGKSEPLPPERQSFRGRTAAMASSIGSVLRASAEPAWLCGHSYGGNVALHAAIEHADQVQGLVLLEPVCFRALALIADDTTFASGREFFEAYAGAVESGESRAVSRMVDYWFGQGAFLSLPEAVQGYLVGAAARNAQDVRSAFAETIESVELARLAMPVLIVCGGASPPVAPAIAKALSALVPQARIEAIAGATHGMLDAHADAVAGLVRTMTRR